MQFASWVSTEYSRRRPGILPRPLYSTNPPLSAYMHSRPFFWISVFVYLLFSTKPSLAVCTHLYFHLCICSVFAQKLTVDLCIRVQPSCCLQKAPRCFQLFKIIMIFLIEKWGCDGGAARVFMDWATRNGTFALTTAETQVEIIFAQMSKKCIIISIPEWHICTQGVGEVPLKWYVIVNIWIFFGKQNRSWVSFPQLFEYWKIGKIKLLLCQNNTEIKSKHIFV